VALSANLLVVDTEVVERLSAPAENELQNVVKLFHRKVVRRAALANTPPAVQAGAPDAALFHRRWHL
jgi:hypothetical protein